IGVPASVGIHRRVIQLIEKAVAVVEDEHVAIAGAGGSALNRSGRGDWHGAGIALAAVGAEIHVDQRLTSIDHDVGNAVGRVGAPVGMNVHRAHPTADDGAGIGVDGRGGEVGGSKGAAGGGDKKK